MSYSKDVLYSLYFVIMLCSYQIPQCQWIYRLIIRPAENFVIHSQLGITVDFSQKVVPFSRLTCCFIYSQVQRMYRLTDMVARKGKLALWNSVNKPAVVRIYGSSAFRAHKTVFTKHSKKIVLWIRYIEMVAVRASYYPLCLR